MQAVQYVDHGDASVIEYDSYPDPEPARGAVLVDIKAAALNYLDLWTRRGLPGLDLELLHVPGSDGAGVVSAVGDGVSRFEPGDRVALTAGRSCGTCEFCRDGEESMCVAFSIIGEHSQGVHAELASVPEANLVAVPDDVAWTVAGSAPLVFQTAWRMLHTRADLSAGETVLVLGASGGVGHAAVQIAAHAGATVLATASTEEKLEVIRRLGADETFNYEQRSVPSTVREYTDGRGVDIVVDHVGAATWADSLSSLAKGGRLVTCGATSGATPETDIRRIFWNQLEVIGSTMATPGEIDDVLQLVWDGTFEPHIRAVLAMSEAARAQALLEDREGVGKVVLVPDSERE